ncbi:site-specific integrase [[Kitasatospora] papulosa]|uniref:hypothetical protein n=1 Tax=[Kitasatospora] papulosa TaxID=1464011 RepID=UPI0037182F4F
MPEDQKPSAKQARGMLNEYKKTWAKRTTVPKAPPITEELLRAMVATCDLQGAATGACSSLAGGPSTAGSRSPICPSPTSRSTTTSSPLDSRSSKTDQETKGEHTDIPADDDPLLDPVAAGRNRLTALHHLGIREGALFRALTSRGTLQNRAVAKERGDYVTGDAVNDWVRSCAHKAGARNCQQITAHRLRRAEHRPSRKQPGTRRGRAGGNRARQS